MKQHDPITHLRILNRRGKVALFVGAGVSLGCGLPDWNALIDRLMKKAFPDQTEHVLKATDHYTSISRTRLIRLKLANKFCQSVADALYSESYMPSKAVGEIVRSGIRRIVCYNFDDILEEAYTTGGQIINTVTKGERFNNNFRGTAVFHPHGILPSNATGEELRCAQIVFSESEYNELYSNPYNWSNLIQLSLLMNYTCFFVGCSLQDPNIRRLLDTFNGLGFSHWHYAVFRSPMYAAAEWDKPLAKQVKRTLEADLSSLRVKPVWINQYEDLPKVLKSIRNKKEKD